MGSLGEKNHRQANQSTEAARSAGNKRAWLTQLGVRTAQPSGRPDHAPDRQLKIRSSEYSEV